MVVRHYKYVTCLLTVGAGALTGSALGIISLSRGTDTPSAVPPAAMSPPPLREQYLLPRAVQNSTSALGIRSSRLPLTRHSLCCR